jgi:cytoskeletal protein CcmA (bactofilin family)
MLRAASKDAEIAETTDDTQERFGRGQGFIRTAGAAQSRTVSVLGGGMTVTGDVTGEGELRIEGRVEGSVKTNGRVIVESTGEVEGGIEAGEVVASGKVSGKITAKGAVRLKNGCKVEADVHAPTIELEEGGTVNGRLEMKTAG